MHPEQYSNSFSDDEIARLREALLGVTSLACETLADSEQFPAEWLMKYRWDKGKKASNVLPNGAKIVHLTVGGRTSAIVPSVQKKTGNVAGDVKGDESADEADKKPSKQGQKRKSKADDEEGEADAVEEQDGEEEEVMPVKKTRGKAVKAETNDTAPSEPKKPRRGKKADGETEGPQNAPSNQKRQSKPAVPGERRSTRNRG